MRLKLGLVIYVVVTGVVLLCASCASKVYFTQDAREKLEKAGVDVTELQFYNDKELLLRRKTNSRELTTEEGVVTKLEGLRVQDLRIRRGTPCRIDSAGPNSYFVRFELGEGQVIRFYKNQYDHYQIYADRWVAGRGSIKYGEKDYMIERIGNDCLLMVKNSQRFRAITQRKVAKGVLVDEDDGIRDSIPEDMPVDTLRNPN
jgi:hypothetical protein